MSEPRGLSLGLAHELGLNAAMTSSLLIVLLGGELPPWLWLAAFMPTLSMALSRRAIFVPPIAGTLLGGGAIGAALLSVLRGGLDAAVLAGGVAVVGLLVARLLTRRTLEHDQQALLLSLVLVFAGSVLNVGLSYIVVFVAYAISAVWALSTRQLLAGAQEAGLSPRQARARDDVITPLFFAASGGLAVAVLAAAGLIFVAFPRVGFGELGFLGRKPSQLPPSVGFGADPRGLSASTAVVARVRGVPLESFVAGLYLRGTVYDVVTYDAFAQSDPDTASARVIDTRPALPDLARSGGGDIGYDVLLMPVAGPVVFTLGATRTALTTSGGGANPNRAQHIGGRDRHDQLRTYAPLASPLRYTLKGDVAVVSRIPPPSTHVQPLGDEQRARHLALPPPDPAVQLLLDEILRGLPADADDARRAAAVRSHLLERFTYSLEGSVAGRDAPLRAFLLESRRGHCELFAGAYALLLRMMGIPSRVVGGFQGGALADDGSVVFQQRHAHAWVEWWLDGRGWIVDDATPAATATRERLGLLDGVIEQLRVFWDDRVVDYALEDQQSALSAIARSLRGRHLGTAFRVVVVIVVIGGALLWLAQRLRRRRSAELAGDALAREIVAAVERLGGGRAAPTATVRELVRPGLGDDDARRVLSDALDVYERMRFGGEAIGAARLTALRQALRALRASG
jgi:hypothetical protein